MSVFCLLHTVTNFSSQGSRVKGQGSRVAIFVLGDALFLCVIFLLGEDVLSAYTNAKY